MGLQFAIVVVWVCVLGGFHWIWWRGFRFAGVGVGLPTWVVVGLGLPVWVVVGLGLLAWVSWVWVGQRGCRFASMCLRLA